ncbi:hypothetical protein [Rouxiella badensis]
MCHNGGVSFACNGTGCGGCRCHVDADRF